MKAEIGYSKCTIETVNDRLKKLEDIIYGNKLYIKCPLCNGTGFEYITNEDTVSCSYCTNGYIEVKIKDDGK